MVTRTLAKNGSGFVCTGMHVCVYVCVCVCVCVCVFAYIYSMCVYVCFDQNLLAVCLNVIELHCACHSI